MKIASFILCFKFNKNSSQPVKNDQKNRIFFFHFPLEAIFFIPTKVTSKYFVIALD